MICLTFCGWYQLVVLQCDSKVCMVRIDFEVMTLQDPQRTSVPATDSAGKCVVDQLTFSTSSGDSFGPLCGTETSNSQHLYIDLGYDNTDKATITFATNTAAPTSPSRPQMKHSASSHLESASWSSPDTRAALTHGLDGSRFGSPQDNTQCTVGEGRGSGGHIYSFSCV